MDNSNISTNHSSNKPGRASDSSSKKKSFTWGDLNEASNKFGHALKTMGVKKGDVVAIYLPSHSPEFLVAYFAVARIGAIVLRLNIQNNIEKIFFSNSRPKVLVGLAEEVEKQVDLDTKLFSDLEKIITVGKPLKDTLDFYSMIA